MSDLAIRVESLGKQYRIGETIRHDTVRDLIAALVTGLFRRKRAPVPEQERAFWALQDVSFDVQKGDVLGIIGRNGAGKSTLLKLLSRITAPTRGRIEVIGRVGSLLEVGTGFHSELTGRENIYMNASILGMTRQEIQRKFDEIVAFAQVERFVDTPVKRYSTGMQMRLAFAVAAHIEPEILLVDEVLAVGDVAFQRKCLGKMSEVAGEGRTVLFVSHNMEAIRRLCTRGVLLEDGRLVENADVETVINRYLSTNLGNEETSIRLREDSRFDIGQARTLSICNLDGRPQTIFRTGEEWRIVLEVELFRSVEHFVAIVGVVTIDDLILTMINSVPQDLEAGRYRIEYLWDYPVDSTNLKFLVGLSENDINFYVATDIGNVTISEVANSNEFGGYRGGALLVSPRRAVPEPIEQPVRQDP